MALFDEQFGEVMRIMSGWRSEGAAREFHAAEHPAWPRGATLVLEEDLALELGNPALASVSMLIWSESGGLEDGRITLVGPDCAEAEGGSLPFALVVMVKGSFADAYESYRDIRDAVYDTRLEGLAVRTMPSRQTVWCRVARAAVAKNFSLVDLGSALIGGLKEVEGVEAAEVLFVTSSAEDVKMLAPAARGAQRVVEAMMKMYQEENFDCDTCEYQDVCDTVMDLKKIKKKLTEETGVEGA